MAASPGLPLEAAGWAVDEGWCFRLMRADTQADLFRARVEIDEASKAAADVAKEDNA